MGRSPGDQRARNLPGDALRDPEDDRRWGSQILVTASANVEASRPGLATYNTSKRALAGLVQGAALEYAGDNIRVNAICPGATHTEMIRRQAGMIDAPDAVWRIGLGVWARQNAHGLQRAATAEEIAVAVLNLASPDMTYLNRSLVFVDGGMTAAPGAVVGPRQTIRLSRSCSVSSVSSGSAQSCSCSSAMAGARRTSFSSRPDPMRRARGCRRCCLRLAPAMLFAFGLAAGHAQ